MTMSNVRSFACRSGESSRDARLDRWKSCTFAVHTDHCRDVLVVFTDGALIGGGDPQGPGTGAILPPSWRSGLGAAVACRIRLFPFLGGKPCYSVRLLAGGILRLLVAAFRLLAAAFRNRCWTLPHDGEVNDYDDDTNKDADDEKLAHTEELRWLDKATVPGVGGIAGVDGGGVHAVVGATPQRVGDAGGEEVAAMTWCGLTQLQRMGVVRVVVVVSTAMASHHAEAIHAGYHAKVHPYRYPIPIPEAAPLLLDAPY
uniref:Uncharacterized protein n=1 Tax=Oryza barthii TaxID=65489 RepID=A0A2I4S668_9ORYZ|nr:hypothetical protein BAR_18 [Oryza barthii]